MNLHQPLVLTEAKTHSLQMVPTKKFFKAVIVAESPIEKEQAELCGVGHLYDIHGNLRAFEGSYRPAGELSGAAIAFKSTGGVVLSINTEKVAHFAFAISGKKKLICSVRIHLPEDGPASLLPLLELLSDLNKDAFELTVLDSQKSLFGVKPTEGVSPGDPNFKFPEPDEAGIYPMERANVRPFDVKKPKLKASIALMELENGFISGWSVEAQFAKASIGGSALSVRSTVYDSEFGSIEAAAREIFQFIHSDTFLVEGTKETQAWEKLQAYLYDIVPALQQLAPEGAVQ